MMHFCYQHLIVLPMTNAAFQAWNTKRLLLPQGGGGGGVCKIVYITVLNTGKNFQLISELTELSKN